MKKLASIIAITLVLAACSSKNKDEVGLPLSYVPATTAYVFGNLEPMPDATQNRFSQMFVKITPGLLKTMDRAIESLAKSDKFNTPAAANTKIVLEELRNIFKEGGFEALGMDTKGRLAVYEINAQPVARFELANAGKFGSFIANLEKRMGANGLVKAEIDGLPYWHTPLSKKSDKEHQVDLVMSVIGNQAVIAILANNSGTTLPTLLGLEKPSSSILSSGELQAINLEYGYQAFGTLLIKPEVMFERYIGGTDQNGAWLTRSAGQGQKQEPLSAVCRSELDSIAAKVPRIVSGITSLSEKTLETRAVVQFEPSLAQSLSELSSPVPGLGAGSRNPVEIGVGVDLNKLAGFIQTQINAVNTAPYQCADLQDLNTSIAELSKSLPGLYMVAGWINGFRANFTSTNLEGNAFKGALLVASPNPMGLVAMAQSYLPNLAQLDLAPGSAPQRIDSSILGMFESESAGDEMWVATSEKAVGFSLGEGSGTQLSADLKAAPANPAPFLYFGLNNEAYTQLSKEITDLPEDKENDPIGYIFTPLIKSFENYAQESVNYRSGTVTFTGKGLEYLQMTELKN